MSDQSGLPGSESGSRKRPLVAGVLLVVAVLLIGTGAVLGARVVKARHADSARSAALHAARQEAVNLVALDYRHVDADVAGVLGGATGDFHDQYNRDASRVKDVVTANQVRSTGSVLEAGIVSSDAHAATVLVVIDSLVRNKANTTGVLRHYRMQLEMSLQKGHWQARSLQFVS